MPSKKTDNKEIIVAVIGVVGAVLTAMVVNWGQYIFNRDSVSDGKTDKTPPVISQNTESSGKNGSVTEIPPDEYKKVADGKPDSAPAKVTPNSAGKVADNKIDKTTKLPPSPPQLPPPPPPPGLKCGGPIDKFVAVADLEALAAKGCHLAEFELGKIYMYGRAGVEVNKVQAVLWMRRAAEGDVAGAQHNLGYMYQEGFGVKKDVQMAWIWYGKAARNGKIDSQKVLIEANKTW